MGTIQYTNEFTDASPALAKVSGITTVIRLRGENGYQYKTLVLLLKSSYVNQLISSNNDIDTFSFFEYSNIIINNDGDYVISNGQFQGTNFTDYMMLYNDNFTRDDAKQLRTRLVEEDYTDVLYYKNNRGQDCAYTIVPVQDSDWHILSIVPLDSFEDIYDFNYYFISFVSYFALLFLLDITLVLGINRQLRHITREAQSANMAKSEFLSAMSHDIRTPMNAIIGMTVIAKDNLEDHPDAETLKECVNTIQLSGNHLLTLINGILDISKIENGKVTLAPEDFSISETMEKMLEIVQPQIKEKSLIFETHIMNVSHEFVHADELRINQVYINILSNAIKYTNAGGRITVDFSEEAIPGRENAARFVYRVTDTGIGMTPEFVKTIFNRFSRAVDTRVNTTQGTGLGMAISKQLVDLMGGTIEVQSQLNVGSVFTVTLDLLVADARVQSVPLKNMSALLIDDDSILLETAKLSLLKAGMAVETAMDGETGIKMAASMQAQSKAFDVILVDWKMSRMNGIQVVRALRQQVGSTVKIVVMTAYNIADIERDARAAGVDAFITKPLFQSKLQHTIQSLFTKKEDANTASTKHQFDLRVLIAEDNNTNWKVLAKLLTRYGIQAERAENGQIAVDMVKNSCPPFDMVLMDIQMPVMNGYASTEAIRMLEEPDRASIPIYAMTADAFAEDVAKCLQTGMNGHLAKPIEIDKLLKVLTQVSEKVSKQGEQS